MTEHLGDQTESIFFKVFFSLEISAKNRFNLKEENKEDGELRGKNEKHKSLKNSTRRSLKRAKKNPSHLLSLRRRPSNINRVLQFI